MRGAGREGVVGGAYGCEQEGEEGRSEGHIIILDGVGGAGRDSGAGGALLRQWAVAIAAPESAQSHSGIDPAG